MTHRIQIAIALLLFFSTGVAQELLTMDGAVGIALERSHQLQAANFDRTSATWGKRTALTNFLPRVELASEATRIDAETDRRANAAIDFIRGSAPALGIPPSALQDIQPLAYRNSYSSTVTVVQPLYNGGAELVRLDAANAMQDRAEYAYADAEQRNQRNGRGAGFPSRSVRPTWEAGHIRMSCGSKSSSQATRDQLWKRKTASPWRSCS
jgi:outer membrane protein TolC